jgi:hypothetical protein
LLFSTTMAVEEYNDDCVEHAVNDPATDPATSSSACMYHRMHLHGHAATWIKIRKDATRGISRLPQGGIARVMVHLLCYHDCHAASQSSFGLDRLQAYVKHEGFLANSPEIAPTIVLYVLSRLTQKIKIVHNNNASPPPPRAMDSLPSASSSSSSSSLSASCSISTLKSLFEFLVHRHKTLLTWTFMNQSSTVSTCAASSESRSAPKESQEKQPEPNQLHPPPPPSPPSPPHHHALHASSRAFMNKVEPSSSLSSSSLSSLSAHDSNMFDRSNAEDNDENAEDEKKREMLHALLSYLRIELESPELTWSTWQSLVTIYEARFTSLVVRHLERMTHARQRMVL